MLARESRQKQTKAAKIIVNVLACRGEEEEDGKTEESAEMIDCLLLIKA